jgi:hypothetical protein
MADSVLITICICVTLILLSGMDAIKKRKGDK